MAKSKSRRRQCKSVGFKKGTANPNKGKKLTFDTTKICKKYVRLYKEPFENRINKKWWYPNLSRC